MVAEEPVVHRGCYEEFLAGFDPDYSPREVRHEPRVPHVQLGPNRQPLAGATLQSTPFPPMARYPPNSNPQLVSLHGCEGPIKTLGFLFICVCLRVGPSLSRIE